jgi:hypothetical protein
MPPYKPFPQLDQQQIDELMKRVGPPSPKALDELFGRMPVVISSEYRKPEKETEAKYEVASNKWEDCVTVSVTLRMTAHAFHGSDDREFARLLAAELNGLMRDLELAFHNERKDG